ncbi:juvenile hormone acid O-methyltransferase-like [Saccoglossus kowalevskii]|uniref:Uncharacterized protein LOC102800802 n=1 Tax=Saccoglossus kowalevskii TaxID=10224 RepID=A0ABM0LZQ6_SACKO|nr:PREDICTED: uncharacterized protein LOC102800802 [Saccoglossus kowalevskii]
MNYSKVDSYSKHRHVQHNAALQTLSLLDGHWRDGDVVLDVGCGTGDETKMIAEMDNVSSVIDVDVLTQMIEYAKKHNKITGKMEYLHADVCTLVEDHPQLCNRFTKVVSFFCFHRFENQKDALKNVYACLSDGGECAIHVVYKSAAKDTNKQMNRHEKWKHQLQGFNDGLYMFPGSPEEFAESVRECGFTEVKCYSGDMTIIYSAEQMKGNSMNTLSYFDNISNTTREFLLIRSYDVHAA